VKKIMLNITVFILGIIVIFIRQIPISVMLSVASYYFIRHVYQYDISIVYTSLIASVISTILMSIVIISNKNSIL